MQHGQEGRGVITKAGYRVEATAKGHQAAPSRSGERTERDHFLEPTEGCSPHNLDFGPDSDLDERSPELRETVVI